MLEEAERPPVVTWYRAYAGLMAAVYVLCVVGGIAMIVFREDLARNADEPASFWLIYGVFLALVSAVFIVPFVAAFFVPRKPWAWVYHIVLICLGLSSPCCLPISGPLLYYWLKPETRAYFGRPPR